MEQINHFKRIILKIFLVVAIFFIVVIGLSYLPVGDGGSSKGEDSIFSKEERLNDPELVYASFVSSGLCGNDQGEDGGCNYKTFFYKSGKLIEESSWFGTGNRIIVYPMAEKQLDQDSTDTVLNLIKEKDMINANCAKTQLYDIAFSYYLNVDGVKKFFDSSPSQDCRDEFDKIESLIDSLKK